MGTWGLLVSIVTAGFVLWTPRASADTWTETSESDFLGGTLTNVQVTPSGDVTLAGSGSSGLTKQGVVVDHGPTGSYDDVRVFNPFVLRETATSWKMWYTAYDGSRFRMAFADSTDGLTWTKRGVIINVLTAPWNFDSVSGMSVIKEGATYHMWFAGGFWTGSPCPAGYWSQVYYATSSDGMSWSITGSVLGLGPFGAWDGCNLAAPSVVYDGSLYRLYYTGWDGSTQHVGLATSVSKTGFSRYAGNPVLSPGPAGTWEDWYIAASAVTAGTPWEVYYAASDGTNGRLGLATSTDGYSWTKDPGNPVLDMGPAAWDSQGIASAVLVANPGGDRLYYAGSDGTYIRTGYALVATGGYVLSGSYTSRVFDSGGLGTRWQTIAWSVTTPPGTTVSLFVRVGNTPTPGPSWMPWTAITGPSSGTPLPVARTEFIQYRADLATTDTSVTPALHDVTITYAPNAGPTVSPTSPSGVWLQTQTPTFAWAYSDPEGDPQVQFEVQVSSELSFNNYLSSGVRVSQFSTWDSPMLEERWWHWRVRGADSFGAWSGWTTASFGIDVTPPTTFAILAGSTGSADWYTGPVTVTLASYDNVSSTSETEYRVDGGPWQQFGTSFPVSGDGAHRVDFYATDVAGNVEAVRGSTFRIDATPPVTTASLSGQLGQNGWYTSSVDVSLWATDATSGVGSTEYRVDGGAWQLYTSAVSVAGDAPHVVEFQSTDFAGNVEVPKSVGFRIDTATAITNAAVAGQLGGGGWYTSEVTVTMAASDATSGLLSTRYRVDSGGWQAYANPVIVRGDGEHEVEFQSTDTAGNVEPVQSVSFRIDTTEPATEAFLSGSLGNGGWYTGLVVVTLAAADVSSGVAFTEFRVDGAGWQAYAEPIEVAGDGPHAVEFRSTDVAGLQEEIQAVGFDVDGTPPATIAVPIGTIGDNQWFTGSVAVTLVAVDTGSGVAVTVFRLDDAAWQDFTAPIAVTGDGMHPLGFRSTDFAGNVEALALTQIRIDTTVPTTTAMLLGQRPADIYTSHVVVELAGEDVTSGVAFTEIRVDAGAWQPYTGAFRVTGDGAHTVEFRSTDLAGNEEGVKSVSFQIDTSLLSPSGPVGPWLLVLLIAVVAGFVILGFLLLRKRRKPEEEAAPAEAVPPPPGANQ